MAKGLLNNYLDSQRMQSRDKLGRPNYQKYEHLPLVAFVDSETGEELVFNKIDDLPKELTRMVSSTGNQIAIIE